jgi:lipoate-protein ligase B
MHGMSFNVDLDLKGFSLIIGCGLVGEKVTSLRELLGPTGPSIDQVRDAMARHFSAACARHLTLYTIGRDCPELLRRLL